MQLHKVCSLTGLLLFSVTGPAMFTASFCCTSRGCCWTLTCREFLQVLWLHTGVSFCGLHVLLLHFDYDVFIACGFLFLQLICLQFLFYALTLNITQTYQQTNQCNEPQVMASTDDHFYLRDGLWRETGRIGLDARTAGAGRRDTEDISARAAVSARIPRTLTLGRHMAVSAWDARDSGCQNTEYVNARTADAEKVSTGDHDTRDAVCSGQSTDQASPQQRLIF